MDESGSPEGGQQGASHLFSSGNHLEGQEARGLPPQPHGGSWIKGPSGEVALQATAQAEDPIPPCH